MKKAVVFIFKLFVLYCCFAYAPIFKSVSAFDSFISSDGMFSKLFEMLSPSTVIDNFKTVGNEGAAIGSYFDFYKSSVIIMGIYYLSLVLAFAGKAISHNANIDLRHSYRVLYYNSKGEKTGEETVTEGGFDSLFANILVALFALVFALLTIPVLFIGLAIKNLRVDSESPAWFYITQILNNIGIYMAVYWFYKMCTTSFAYGHYPVAIIGVVLILSSRIAFKVLDDE